jgi:guanylate kinase
VEGEEDFTFSVSATTRPPRQGEQDGVDYWFVTEEEFLRRVEEGELAEWARVHGDLYGTPRSSLEAAARAGLHAVLEIDVQGAMQIREAVPEALLLFILPPSVDVLFARLTGRGTEEESAVRRRLNTALGELEAAEAFDFFVINDDLERAVEEVRVLARTGRPPAGRSSGTLQDALGLRGDIETLLNRGRLF